MPAHYKTFLKQLIGKPGHLETVAGTVWLRCGGVSNGPAGSLMEVHSDYVIVMGQKSESDDEQRFVWSVPLSRFFLSFKGDEEQGKEGFQFSPN